MVLKSKAKFCADRFIVTPLPAAEALGLAADEVAGAILEIATGELAGALLDVAGDAEGGAPVEVAAGEEAQPPKIPKKEMNKTRDIVASRGDDFIFM